MARALTNCDWYHGAMPRHEIEELLRNDGDFLLRKTEVQGQVRIAISVRNTSRNRHILVSYADGLWWVRDEHAKKRTLQDLIEYHLKTKSPVQSDGTVLKNVVPRPDYYILHDHIELGDCLGAGAYGEVYAAKLKRGGKEIDCAVKRLKGVMHKRERTALVKEAHIMRTLSHPNIVHVYGVAPQEDPIMIVLELAPGGTLKAHLKKKSKEEVTVADLVRYCKEAANGMLYLSSNKVIHRDIAARNCLLGIHGEVKISDFGLSVASEGTVKLQEVMILPTRWLAPETLRKLEYSTKSDVWSFGVLMWEIFARCSSDPFPGRTNKEARAIILSGQTPMEAPEEMPTLHEEIMKLCFAQDPQARIDFVGIVKLLSQ